MTVNHICVDPDCPKCHPVEDEPDCLAAGCKTYIAALDELNARLKECIALTAERDAALSSAAACAKIVSHVVGVAREGGSMDGGDAQKWLEEAGLLIPEWRVVPCADGDNCACTEYVATGDDTLCYRNSPVLTELLRAIDSADASN